MSASIVHGIPVSVGIAIGPAVFAARKDELTGLERLILPDAVEAEAARLLRGLDTVRQEMEDALHRLPSELKDQSGIINAHLMICRDPKLRASALAAVTEGRLRAEWAVHDAVEDVAKVFSIIENSYIRERMQDLRAVARRIVRHLQGKAANGLTTDQPCVLLAQDLTPLDTLQLPREKILALVTEQGGRTSHTGIIARSMQIPAVVGVGGLEESIRQGDMLVVDATSGVVHINPDDAALRRYRDLEKRFFTFQETVQKHARLPAETACGHRIAIRGNIESRSEGAMAAARGGEGIGLFRTEFAYMSRSTLPGEDELYAEYAALAEEMAPNRVTFRTLDIGADKQLGTLPRLDEANPALGLRGIRYCLRHQDIFRSQLRAILRASMHGKVAVMFPMISGIRELMQAKAVYNEVKQELETSRIPFDPAIPLGIMVELPSAFLTCDILAPEVDFFSIGTNDLIQYFLGIDRTNRHVAHLYQPLHPAIFRAIKFVVDVAHQQGISVGVCGEMATDPYCLPILLGVGVDELSMAPQSIPGIKHIVRSLDMEENQALIREVYWARSAKNATRLLKQALSNRFAGELPFYTSILDMEQ